MKKATQLLVVALIIVGFASNGLAEEQANPFHGFWRTGRGSIIKIDGDQGVFVYTAVESWKAYVDQVVVKNIRQKDGKWVADEYIAPEGRPFWAEVDWELKKDRIVRQVSYQGKRAESYYERIDAVSPGETNPGTHASRKSRNGNEGKIGVGGRILFVSYYDDNYHVNGVKVNADPDEAAMYGVTVTWFVHEYLSIELSCDYVETDVELSSLGLSGDAGQLTQVPVLLTLRSHFSTNTRVSPYLGIGGGYYFNDFDSETAGVGPIYGAGAEIDVNNNYGLHVCGGIEFMLTDSLALDLNLRYVWTEVEVEVNGFSDEEFRADAFVGGLALKLYF